MKKLFTLLLVLACSAAVLSGCCMSHEWVDATCETPKTCAKCEETEGEALGHSWTDADCVAPKTCTACGITEGEALGHQVTWLPDSEDFYRMRGTCSVCSEEMIEEMNWVMVADNFILGNWKGSYVSYGGGNLSLLDAANTFEIREDGTATMTLEGQTIEFTWDYRTHSIPDENFNIAALMYNFVDSNLNACTLSINYHFGREVDTIFLYADKDIYIFQK